LEKDIQKVFEANLPAIMGLELVKSEFTIKAAQVAFFISLKYIQQSITITFNA